MIIEILKTALLPVVILIVALIVNRTIKQHLTGVFHRQKQEGR